MEQNLSCEEFSKTGLRVLQDKSHFSFGIDAVLLANFARVKKDAVVFDLGTGNGIIPLLMSKTCPASHFTALEIQEESALIATKNVEINNLNEKIEVIQGDIKDVRNLFVPECANVVTSNPPAMKFSATLKMSCVPHPGF